MGALAAIVARLDAERPAAGRQLVAIDGIGGSGKTMFAASSASEVTSRAVVVVHVDDFLEPPEVRHARGRHSAEGFWLDAYDYDALIEDVLEPPGAGRERFRPAPAASLSAAADDALVLVEGTFLLRDRPVGRWNSSIHLTVPFSIAAARMVERGTITHPLDDPRAGRYIGAQRLCFEQATPWRRASLVVDNTDWSRPRVVETPTAPAWWES